MSLSARLAICRACPHRQRKCAGRCPCKIDGVDSSKHAEERYCPLGKYRLGFGDWIARLLEWLKVRKLAAKMMGQVAECNRCWQRDPDAEAICGCKERQLAANGIKASTS